MAQKKSKSPYQKYGKSPFRYSELKGIAFYRMLVQRFGAHYWTKFDERGRLVPMFPAEAYRGEDPTKAA